MELRLAATILKPNRVCSNRQPIIFEHINSFPKPVQSLTHTEIRTRDLNRTANHALRRFLIVTETMEIDRRQAELVTNEMSMTISRTK